jgi:hypothetical protein
MINFLGKFKSSDGVAKLPMKPKVEFQHSQKAVDYAGLLVDEGCEVINRVIVPYWTRRSVTRMDLDDWKSEKATWILYLDCGHEILETYSKGERPAGMYRDCSVCKAETSPA